MFDRWLAVMGLLAVFLWSGGPCSYAETLERPEDQGWFAFFKPPQGTGQRIRLPLEQYADSDWFHLKFSEYSGPRMRLEVLAEDDLPDVLEGATSGIGPAERLASGLDRTHRFNVVLLGEEAAGAAVAGNRPGSGGQYLIHTSPEISGAGEVLRVTVRILDARGGQVLFSTTESAKVVHPGTEKFNLSRALEVCINKAIYRLTFWLVQRPWVGSVVAVESGRVVIDAGSWHGLAPKMQLRALVPREVIDPESGQLLGAATQGRGILELVAVQEQQAVARVVEGCEKLAAGDQVELVQ